MCWLDNCPSEPREIQVIEGDKLLQSVPIKTRIVGKSDAIFAPLLKLALKASSIFSYTQAIRTEHTANLKFAGSLPLQARDATMNLWSFGGPMVLFKARAEGMRNDRAEIKRTRDERNIFRIIMT